MAGVVVVTLLAVLRVASSAPPQAAAEAEASPSSPAAEPVAFGLAAASADGGYAHD